MRLPKPRGGLSEWLVARLADPELSGSAPGADSWDDESISLWTLHELSFRGFEDADDRAEWDPDLLAVRRDLETALEDRLRARWTEAGVDATPAPADVPTALEDLVAADDGPSLADFVRRRADRDQVLELLRQRSVYHLKESDPSAFVVPRLPVRAKAALMALQFDEYGDGDPNRLHSHLFARGLEAVGLRAEYGAYVDDAVPENLEMNNAGSLFGLHRRLRGAAMGHLAAFEMTSSLPSRKMVQGLDRLGLEGPMSDYYDEHVEADAIHEHLAARDICGTLADDEPDQAAEILFGAFTCLDVEARFATAMLGRGRTSGERARLRPPRRRARAARPDAAPRRRVRAGPRGHRPRRRPPRRRPLPLREVEPPALVRRDAQGHPAQLNSALAARLGAVREPTVPGSALVAGTPPAGVSYDLRPGRCGRAPRAPVGAPRPSRAGPRRSRVRGAGPRSGRGCRPGARPSRRGRGGRR